MKQLPTDEPLTYRSALSMDVDAFIWISTELARIWQALIIEANDPDSERLQRIAADMYSVVDEAKEFVVQSQQDLETLEKEASNHEQDPINSGDG